MTTAAADAAAVFAALRTLSAILLLPPSNQVNRLHPKNPKTLQLWCYLNFATISPLLLRSTKMQTRTQSVTNTLYRSVLPASSAMNFALSFYYFLFSVLKALVHALPFVEVKFFIYTMEQNFSCLGYISMFFWWAYNSDTCLVLLVLFEIWHFGMLIDKVVVNVYVFLVYFLFFLFCTLV